MANLSSDQDSGATQPIDPTLPQPATHGQVHVDPNHPNHDVLVKQMTDHLAQHVSHLNATADYGGHGTGFSSQGSLTPSGSSGADYSTSSADSVGDADSGGPSGY